MTEIDVKEEQARNGRNPLLILGGLAILGIALALLIYGGSLFGGEEADRAGEMAFLQQVPDLNTTSGLARLPSGNETLAVGNLAYDFQLQDLNGRSISLTDFRGQPVIVNFWATWCAPCRIEMPELQATYEKYKDDGLVILALDQDESPEVVRSFFYDEFGLTFTPLLDVEQEVAQQYGVFNFPSSFFINADGEVAQQYGVFNFPSSFFINADGVITAIHRGPVLQSQLEEYLADMIQ